MSSGWNQTVVGERTLAHVRARVASRGEVTSRAMSCQACRLSKVKCEGSRGGPCARCVRLGLECRFTPCKRGRPNVQRDIARLGPAVRALLKSTGSTGGESFQAIETALHQTHEEQCRDRCILDCDDRDCQDRMVAAIGSRAGQIALIKHWLLIGVRSGSCALLGNVLVMASNCGLTLGDITMQIDRTIELPTFELPTYIQEWFDQPHRMCCVRGQKEGYVSWRVNDSFHRAVGDVDALREKLKREHPSALTNPEFLICTAEALVATLFHPEDRMRLVEVNSALWAQAQPATHINAEVVSFASVRCMLNQYPDYVPCELRARTVIQSESRQVCTVFSLTLLQSCDVASTLGASKPGAGGSSMFAQLETDQRRCSGSSDGFSTKTVEPPRAMPVPVIADAFPPNTCTDKHTALPGDEKPPAEMDIIEELIGQDNEIEQWELDALTTQLLR